MAARTRAGAACRAIPARNTQPQLQLLIGIEKYQLEVMPATSTASWPCASTLSAGSIASAPWPHADGRAKSAEVAEWWQ